MTLCAVLPVTGIFQRLLTPTYLIAKQSRDAGFRGIAYGCEVVTALQGEHYSPACQTHQLPGQVAEAWTARKWQQRGEKRGGGEMSTDVEALSSLLDIVQRKKSGFEEKGNCIRERRWTARWIYWGALALIWDRFDFNNCSFVFRLGRHLWSLCSRMKGFPIYVFSHVFFPSGESDPDSPHSSLTQA